MIPSAIRISRSSFSYKNNLRTQQLLIGKLNIYTNSAYTNTPSLVRSNIVNLQPVFKDVFQTARSYCCKVNIPVVEYAEVKDLPNHPEKMLVDVREPSELKETGLIPTAINIPLGSVAQELALSVSSEQFQKKYGRPKPDVNTYIIMHCRIGKRSQNAAETAATLGYKNVHNYVGSWLDWAERENLPK